LTAALAGRALRNALIRPSVRGGSDSAILEASSVTKWSRRLSDRRGSVRSLQMALDTGEERKRAHRGSGGLRQDFATLPPLTVRLLAVLASDGAGPTGPNSPDLHPPFGKWFSVSKR